MEKFLKNHCFDEFNNIWITSDLHLRHENIQKFEPNRKILQEKEQFQGTPDEFIIYKYNQQVQENDLVINLGDLHWKSFEPFKDKLNGTMLLVLGNHDMKPAYYNKFDIFTVDGIWNLNGIPKKYHFKTDDKLLSGFILDDILFSHYPICSKSLEHEKKYRNNKIINRMEILSEVKKENNISLNIHGHIHSAKVDCTNMINACIDFTDFNLINLKDIR